MTIISLQELSFNMPIDFPREITIENLESCRPIYSEMKPDWGFIDLLCAGGHRIKKQAKKLLPQRFDEAPEVYSYRLKKFTYLNVIGDALRKQVSRLSQGNINVSNIPAAEESFFDRFRESTNGKGRTEKQLIGMMFEESLKYKYLFLHVDQPPAEFVPQSLADREQLDREGVLPYINLYTPLDVRDWEGEADSSKLAWIKTRTVSSVSMSVFGVRLTQVKWTFITWGGTASYSALCQLDEEGNILTLVDENGKPRPTTKLTAIPLEAAPVLYDLPYAPVVLMEVPQHLWLADDVFLLAYQHLWLSNHHQDLLTYAYFQRTYKKVEKVIPDLEEEDEESSAPILGSAYIPELEKHEWSEPTGAIVKYIQSALDKVEHQVRSSIALSAASVSPTDKTVVEQSGVSKQMDYVMSSELIEQYGGYLCDALQDAYQLVLYYRGYGLESAENEALSVSGLDHFETDSLDDMINSLLQFLSVDLAALQQRVPPTLFTLIMKRLVSLLLGGNITPAERNEIEQEMERMQLRLEPAQPQTDEESGQVAA